MWLKETSAPERKTLTAAFAGYGVDAFDYMIYTFLIPTLITAWGMSKVEAGYIATSTEPTDHSPPKPRPCMARVKNSCS